MCTKKVRFTVNNNEHRKNVIRNEYVKNYEKEDKHVPGIPFFQVSMIALANASSTGVTKVRKLSLIVQNFKPTHSSIRTV